MIDVWVEILVLVQHLDRHNRLGASILAHDNCTKGAAPNLPEHAISRGFSISQNKICFALTSLHQDIIRLHGIDPGSIVR